MSLDIPFKPLGRQEIHRLEYVLLTATITRPDILARLKGAEVQDRLTWVDSLGVAAGALAREKAGLSVPEIAEELGRSEATIRNHLTGRTEAGKLVRETYEKLLRGELKPETVLVAASAEKTEEVEKLKKKLEEYEKTMDEVRKRVREVVELLQTLLE